MSAEVWKDFEAALGSSPVLARRRETHGKESGFFRKTFKPLRRLRAAKDLLDAMMIASVGKLDYDVEPNTDILPTLKRAVQFLETRLPDPWDKEQRSYKPSSVLARLEDEVALAEVIEELHGIGASIFYETYWEDIIYPEEDYEGYLQVSHGQDPVARFLLHVVISASEKDRETFPEVMNWGVTVIETETDDVPF
jgi:hypothetical protein